MMNSEVLLAEIERLNAEIARLKWPTVDATWLIYFDDLDRRPEVFTDGPSALKRYEDCLEGSTCTLFCTTSEIARLSAALLPLEGTK